MARKRFTPEQIIGMLRETEVRLSQGEKVKHENYKWG
jgi:putative transposase